MNDFMKKIFEAYENEYGKGEKLQDGEMQVFLLQDRTVVLSLENGELGVKVTADKPIKCDFESGMFVESEE